MRLGVERLVDDFLGGGHGDPGELRAEFRDRAVTFEVDFVPGTLKRRFPVLRRLFPGIRLDTGGDVLGVGAISWPSLREASSCAWMFAWAEAASARAISAALRPSAIFCLRSSSILRIGL